MRYKPKSIAALQLALGGLPDQMRVELDSDIEISASSVRELRKVTVWPENLCNYDAAGPPSRERGKVSVVTRTSPKR
jgi:hypothetical protein